MPKAIVKEESKDDDEVFAAIRERHPAIEGGRDHDGISGIEPDRSGLLRGKGATAGEDHKSPHPARSERALAASGLDALVDLEVLAIDQPAAYRHGKIGPDRIEVDALQGFGDVKLPGFAVVAEAVPVEDAVGRVGGRLDLGDEQARSDGVGGSGRQEMAFAWLHGHPGRAQAISL